MEHFALDSDNDSVIHQDSDEDDNVEHDDDIDIGFRRHQYETFDDDRPKRRRTKEDSIYGVFMEDDDRIRKRSRGETPTAAPMFVAAKKTQEPPKTETKPENNDKTPNETEQTDEKKDEEESPEDKAVKEKQKAADEYFLSLLNQGRGKMRQRRQEQSLPTPPPKQEADSLEGMAPGLGMPTAFGRMEAKPPEPIKKAKWEKHTKGIGSKLLAKMGWKGEGGLGSNRRKHKKKTEDSKDGSNITSEEQEEPKVKKGISKPIEVVVRPANLGLGFGNFKEASQLKSNRQIEAEVRGIELKETKKKDDDEEEQVSWAPATASSAIPSTADLLSQKSWKRHRKASQKNVQPQIIPYTELLERQKESSGQPVIIDMRGPSSDKNSAVLKDGKVPLGEELLHNVSFLLNTHENRLHSCSHFVKSTERKCQSLKSDIEEMKQRQIDGNSRLSKLKMTLSTIDQVETITQQELNDDSSRMNDESPQEKVQRLVQELGEAFSAEERQSLKFWEILAPTLLSPILQIQLNEWDPLGGISSSRSVIDSIFKIDLETSRTKLDEDSVRSLRKSIIQNQLLPRIKQVLESRKWDPCRDIEVALDLYEYLHQKASTFDHQSIRDQDEVDVGQVFPGENPEQEDRRGMLSEIIKKELIFDTIHPKIQSTLVRWKPELAARNGESKRLQLENRVDLWILPWIPHMDHPAILPNLLSDCRRKVKNAVTFLQRKGSNDLEFLRSVLDLLRPWGRVFEANSIQRLVSEFVTPYLARCLAKQKIRGDVHEQDWFGFQTALEMHARGFLSDIEFISIVEGELLSNWAIAIHGLLLNGNESPTLIANYREWKVRTLVKPDLDENVTLTIDNSLKMLRQDQHICCIFYSVLRMIQIANSSTKEHLDEMQPSITNFRVVAARRTKEKQREIEEDFTRIESRSASEIEARIRLQRRNIQTPTFRDVLEEFANERGILFQPRIGVNSRKDGKQVFLFGETPIYMVGDVIYAFKQATWQPVALDQLAKSTEQDSNFQ